jgi:hypothetical protein
MKKTLLTTLSLALVGFSFAQQQNQGKLKMAPQALEASPANQTQLTGFEIAPQAAGAQVNTKPSAISQTKAVTETVIGETFYDLESNSSVQNRIMRHADGTTSTGMTWSNETASYSDRGTGYNYEDATGTWGTFPTSRIETQRVGWPSVTATTAGQETVITHAGTGGFVMNTRNPKGTGTWTESIVPAPTGHWMLWPRAATGGANGNSVHVIGISAPVGNGGTLYNGMDGALLYWRSQDEGATWDLQELALPGIDSTNFTGFRADAYAIATEGDVIAVALFNQWADMTLFKSIDNGTSWTSTLINDFPLDLFVTDQGSDINNDGIFDTIVTCDEAGAVIIDGNGAVHVFYGNMKVIDDDLGDGNTSYFQNSSGMMYWNETMSASGAVMIADVEDLDGDGQLGWAGEWALYYTSLTGFPNVGKDAQDNLYLTYSGYNELYSNGSQNYRHIYLMNSTDNGATWSEYIDVTPDVIFDGFECVFPSMAPMVDDKVRIVYMRDYEPGLAVRGDMDFAGVNEIMYLCIDKDFFDAIDEESALSAELALYPNPANNTVNIAVTAENTSEASITVYDFLGQTVSTVYNGSIPAGTQTHTVDLSSYAEGVYFVTLTQNNQRTAQKLIIAK